MSLAKVFRLAGMPLRSGVWAFVTLTVFTAGLARLPAEVLEDQFGAATPIQGAASVTGSNTQATFQPGEPAHAGVAATHSVWAVWQAPLTGTYTLTTSNSTFDTVLAVYLGDALDRLRVVATNDDVDFQDLTSRVRLRAYAGETFHVAVDGVGGARGSVQLNIMLGGRPMTPWSSYTVQGLAVPSSTFSNRVLLVDFWETTCGTCVEELPDLISLYQDVSPRGFSVVGLAIDTNPGVVSQFVLQHATPYPILIPSAATRATFILSEDTFAMPTKFLVDQQQQIVATYVGGHDPRSETYAFYQAEIAPLLRDPPPLPLEIRRTEDVLTLSWPEVGAPFRLEASSLAMGGNWSPAAGLTRTNQGRVEATVPAGTGAQFFRLNLPVYQSPRE